MTDTTDLIARLREHAYRVAGGGNGDPNYDPETLALETEAADVLEAQAKVVEAAHEVWHGDDRTSFQRKLEVLTDALAAHDARLKEMLGDG